MVGIRLPAAALRKVDELTEALSLPDRSATLRLLIAGGSTETPGSSALEKAEELPAGS